jgi:lysyl-tRNA synthetase class 2
MPLSLLARAAVDNARRRAAGQAERVLDPRLLAAMQAGLPDCSGVALGVDRLLMIARGAATSLDRVLPFDWSRS